MTQNPKTKSTQQAKCKGGFLILDKPENISTFQALRHVKKYYRGLKTGFAGTLDPAATGLMLVGVGSGTRLLRYFEDMPKHYKFQIIPGIVTDTYDTTGTVIKKGETEGISREDVAETLEHFRGEIMQDPPVYSALKIKGKRACDRVRAGEEVTLSPRKITIHHLELSEWTREAWTLEVICSRGAYVRSLAHDIGKKLGCGGAAAKIRRTAIGELRVEDAVPWDKTEAFHRLLPLDTAVPSLPSVTVGPRGEKRISNGNSLEDTLYQLEKGRSDNMYRIRNRSGKLIALGSIDKFGRLVPKTVLMR